MTVRKMTWHYDPAYTGPRFRWFCGAWQMIAYKDGHWSVRYRNDQVAHGRATSPLRAKRCARWNLFAAWVTQWLS